MASAVELDPVPVQDTEDARAALVAADLPYVVDRVAGVVHIDDGLLLLQPDRFLLGLRLHVLATLEDAGLGPSDGGGLRGDAADDVENVARRSVGEHLPLRIDLVVDADKADTILLAESQEDTQFADSAKGVAESADDDDVAGLDTREHLPPLGAEPFLDAFLLNDGPAPELRHPGAVLVPRDEVSRKEQIADLFHVFHVF